MDKEMLKDFLLEASDLFDTAEKALLDLEGGGSFSENFNQIFRTFHSIKGAAGMFGIETLQKHMHYLEALLEDRKTKQKMSGETISYLLKGIDAAKKILEESPYQFEYFDPDTRKNNNPPIENKDKKELNKAKIDQGKKESLPLIYVVDDEEEICQFVKNILIEKNMNVVTFTSCNQFLETIKETPCDLVLSDYKMPEYNGVDLYKAVNKIYPMLPFVLFSGFFTTEICLDAFAKGVGGMIAKPFDQKKLIEVIDNNILRYKTLKLLNNGIDLLIYQFKNLENNLSENVRNLVKSQLKEILIQKNSIINSFVKNI